MGCVDGWCIYDFNKSRYRYKYCVLDGDFNIKKHILIWILILIIISTFVNASIEDKLQSCYTLNDNTSSTVIIDSKNIFNLTSIINTNTYDIPGQLNSALSIDATHNARTNIGYDATDLVSGSFNWWFNMDGGQGAGSVITSLYKANPYPYCVSGTNENIYCYVAGTTCSLISGVSYESSGITMGTFRWNASGCQLFINNVLKDTDVVDARATGLGTNSNLMVGADTGGTNHFDGMIDDISLYNNTLTDTEIAQLWNGGTGVSCSNFTGSIPPTTPPTFSQPTPFDGAKNNTNMTFNVTCIDGNSWLWFDDTTTPSTVVLNNDSVGLWVSNISIDDTYFYTAGCYNSTSGFSTNTTLRNWSYDANSPTLTILNNNYFTSSNLSIANMYNNTLRLNLTFNDTIDLFAYEINISKSGTVFYDEQNLSLSGFGFNYEKEINTSLWGNGRFNINILIADSHTNGKIKDYDIDKSKSKLKFVTPEGNKVTIESVDDATTDAIKKKDRYSFIFNFTDGLTANRTLYIKSQDNKIIYRPESPYKEHFIIWSNKGGNWLDFEPYIASVTEQDDKYYVLTFENLPPYVEFNSIGGLNVYNITYSWYNGNYTIKPTSTIQNLATYLEINMSHDYSIINMSGKLWYNNTVITGTTYKNNSDYYSFMTNFTAPDDVVNITFDYEINVTQTDLSTILFNVSSIHYILPSPPNITSYYPGNLSITIFENTTQYFNVTATDKSGFTFYEWFVNGVSKVTTQFINYFFDFTTAGLNIVGVNVTNPSNGFVWLEWAVNITNINQNPVVYNLTTNDTYLQWGDYVQVFCNTSDYGDNDTAIENLTVTIQYKDPSDFLWNDTIEYFEPSTLLWYTNLTIPISSDATGFWDWRCRSNDGISSSLWFSVDELFEVTEYNIAPTIPTYLSPEGGIFDLQIPVRCANSTDVNTFGDNITYDIDAYYQVNTSLSQSWHNLTVDNPAGFYIWHINDLPPQEDVDFRCRSKDSEDATLGWYNPPGNVTFIEMFNLEVLINENFIQKSSEQIFGVYCDARTQANISIIGTMLDCHADGIPEQYNRYNLSWNKKETLDWSICVTSDDDTFKLGVSCILERNYKNVSWSGSQCSNRGNNESLCHIYKEYTMTLGDRGRQ